MTAALLLAALGALAADGPLNPFPPVATGRHVRGDLVEADFIHRKGQVRTDGGALVDFQLLPTATVLARSAEADLRDLPLGTSVELAVCADGPGGVLRVAEARDDFSQADREGLSYRLDLIDRAAGRVEATARRSGADVSQRRLPINDRTRVWKGAGPAPLTDLKRGDEFLFNTGGGVCTDLWVGPEARRLATESQRARRREFLRRRGLPAWVERAEGKEVTVVLIGDPPSLLDLFRREGMTAKEWGGGGWGVNAVVANDELRTYNPPVDGKRARVLKSEEVSTDRHGCAGLRWVIEPDLLLEGFRKGHYLRMFVHHTWPVEDMPFGEGVYTEAPNVRQPLEEALHYPYRTDFANEHLPWLRPSGDVAPPLNSHHMVVGDLLAIDGANRSGRFRAEHTGSVVDFTVPPYGVARHLGADADLVDLPIGARHHFALHQDDRGEFTSAAVIEDDFTVLAADDLTYRVDAVDPAAGKLLLALHHGPVKDERDATVQPPDLGRGEFVVTAGTRVWRGGRRVEVGDLRAGDELRFNLTGRSPTSRGTCTDVWAGKEAHALATAGQRARHDAALQKSGVPGRVERLEGKDLTVAFFSGEPKDFVALLHRGVKGDALALTPVDARLRPTGPSIKGKFGWELTRDAPWGTYGASGVRWRVEWEAAPAEPFRPGQLLRVHRQGWPAD